MAFFTQAQVTGEGFVLGRYTGLSLELRNLARYSASLWAFDLALALSRAFPPPRDSIQALRSGSWTRTLTSGAPWLGLTPGATGGRPLWLCIVVVSLSFVGCCSRSINMSARGFIVKVEGRSFSRSRGPFLNFFH